MTAGKKRPSAKDIARSLVKRPGPGTGKYNVTDQIFKNLGKKK